MTNPYKKASEDVQKLLQLGQGHKDNVERAISFMKLASDCVFVHWKPDTGTYAVRFKPSSVYDKSALEKDAAMGFHKAGCAVVTEFNDKASVKTGWVCLHSPEGTKPLQEFRKQASLTGSPAKLALVGALLGGAGTGLYKYLMPSEYVKTEAERRRAARTSALIGASIGSIPGLLSGAGVWAHSGLGPIGSFITNYSDMQNDPTYRNYCDNLENHSKAQYHTPADPPPTTTPTETAPSEKSAALSTGFMGPLDLSNSKVVNVDNFNRVTWDATRDGTLSQQNALMTSGVLAATSARTNSGFVSPAGIAGTLINAGIGYATSAVIGKTLGAMGMMNNKTQEKLREMGTWGGLLQGVGNNIR